MEWTPMRQYNRPHMLHSLGHWVLILLQKVWGAYRAVWGWIVNRWWQVHMSWPRMHKDRIVGYCLLFPEPPLSDLEMMLQSGVTFISLHMDVPVGSPCPTPSFLRISVWCLTSRIWICPQVSYWNLKLEKKSKREKNQWNEKDVCCT